MKLYLFNLHNYRDRVIISRPTISEYIPLLGEPYIVSGIAFIANDGIKTEQIVNYPQAMPLYCDGTAAPSYVIVTEETTNEIVSRWWVVDSKIVRNGQARLGLLRDILADYDDEVKSRPMYIRKGWINSINDPAILNSEDMTFNQIKKRELPIMDKSGAAWYVGYLNKEVSATTVSLSGSNLEVYGELASESAYPYYSYNANNPYLSEDYSEFIVNFYSYAKSVLGAGANYVQGWGRNGQATTPRQEDGYAPNPVTQQMFAYGVLMKGGSARGIPHVGSNIANAINDIWRQAQSAGDWVVKARPVLNTHTSSQVQELLRENGKVYRIGNTYKKVKVASATVTKTFSVPDGNAFALEIFQFAINQGNFNVNEGVYGPFSAISYTTTGYVVGFEDVSNQALTVTIPTSRARLLSEAFDIFAVPATAVKTNLSGFAQTSPALSKELISSIQAALPKSSGAAQLFDVQLLPYCPLPDYLLDEDGDGVLLANMTNTESTTYYTTVKDTTSGECSFILYATSNEYKKTLFTQTIETPNSPLDYKVDSQTKMHRLCSPNYNGQFEFSVEKNGGVTGWNVDFTYKPYMPYIRVAPIFGRLYGRDYGDARGLICGGDFSITQTNDAWEQYQLQNKNYQAIFDRQITSMEVNNAVQREQEKWSRGVGALQGASVAGMGGSMVLGTPGAIGGAIVGGAASYFAGQKDRELNERLRQDALSAAKDQFGYQLQQIQALPYSLTKVGAQNINYKYFPFLEIYESTPEEALALKNKILWNGMTIMRVGTVPDYLKTTADEVGTFIQATPLRMTTYTSANKATDGIDGSSYFLDVIAAELEQGVYYK